MHDVLHGSELANDGPVSSWAVTRPLQGTFANCECVRLPSAAVVRVVPVLSTGSFGAGLTRFLASNHEQVLEVGRLRRDRRSGGKTDALDAVRAARNVLAQEQPTEPRSGGEREALRALIAAREGAVNARRAGLWQLRDLLITTPEPLRSELRPLSRAQLLRRLAAVRPDRHRDVELRERCMHCARSRAECSN
jgi:Transposase